MFFHDPTRIALEALRLAQPICVGLAPHGQLADRLRSALLKIYLGIVNGGPPRSRAERFKRMADLETQAAFAADAVEEAIALGVVPRRDGDRMLSMLERLELAFRESVMDRAS